MLRSHQNTHRHRCARRHTRSIRLDDTVHLWQWGSSRRAQTSRAAAAHEKPKPPTTKWILPDLDGPADIDEVVVCC